MSRGMIKWQPFNAVCSGTVMVNHILNKKNNITKPSLSEDQLQTIQEKILTAWQNQDTISIKFYRDGRYYLQTGKVTNIDPIQHKIIINNKNVLFFSQIIEIL